MKTANPLTRLLMISMAMTFAVTLAACQTNAQNCAGWTKPPKANEPVAMVKREPQISRWIAATDRFGGRQGCW